MGEMLTIHAPLTDERREVLHGRLILCIPISEDEAAVFGEGVELLPALIDAARAELANPKVAAQIDVAARIAAVIRVACRRSFFAGALGAPETGRVQ